MISSHVLDTALGSPARNLMVHLDVLEALGEGNERDERETWRRLASAVTNEDGRVSDLADAADLAGRTCRLSFETEAYFIATSTPTFFPRVEILFVPVHGVARYHIPLLLSPFGYSAYRGS
ncbi:MAG TPA: hydroxyisourate hydrolase [Polyangiaceae bacterium]|jgi:5-hydroxyisourate hydrolase|nr:hydroxyisourate hydrolase [Polyangiaceae bacterium]